MPAPTYLTPARAIHTQDNGLYGDSRGQVSISEGNRGERQREGEREREREREKALVMLYDASGPPILGRAMDDATWKVTADLLAVIRETSLLRAIVTSPHESVTQQFH